MSIRRVVPNFQSKNPKESRKFYADFLGMNIGMDMEWIISFVSPDNPTAQLSVISEDPMAHIHPDCSIEVSDTMELYKKAAKLDLKIVYPLTDEPWGVRRFFVEDPNGRVVNVMQHIGEGGRTQIKSRKS